MFDIILKYDLWLPQVEKYGPTMITGITSVVLFITQDVSLAMSQADKNSDGSLSNSELEDIAVGVVKGSKNLLIKMLPEIIIRKAVQKLCSRRKVITPINDIYRYLNNGVNKSDSQET